VNELLGSLLPVRIEVALLVLTRVLALLSTAPPFSNATPWSSFRLPLGATITWLLLFTIGEPGWTGPQFGLALIPLVAMEFLLGALLGWIVASAFAAVRGAGDLITGEVGLNLASLLDPVTGTTTPVMSTLYQTMAGLVFLAMGAHRWVIAGLAHSFHRIPIGTFAIGADPVDGLLLITSRLLEAGIVLAAPVMAAMFLVTLLLGLSSRAVPQLNLMDVGYAIRIAAAFGAIAVLLPTFRIGLESLFLTMRDALGNALPSTVK